jgi:hypothetical protein
MANPETVKQWDVTVPYSLVEVEVNDGLGSPAGESFAATKMKRLDGTKEFPLDVVEVVKELRKKYQTHVQDEQKRIDGAMAEAQKKALGERKPTGPRETRELFYLTWMPESQHLVARFRTRISDGAYQYGSGIVPSPPFKLPSPLPPGKGAPPAAALRPPPPPRLPAVRYGTTFGVEFGPAYEVSKAGKVDRVLTLPIESFQQEIPPPPGVGARPIPPPPARE